MKRIGIDAKASDWKDRFAELPPAAQRRCEQELGRRYNIELDKGCGGCVLRGAEAARLVADALLHYHGDRLYIGDFVIMPNHVHALMTPRASFELEKILQSIKGFSAKGINAELGSSGKLWQRQSYDHIVRDTEQLEAFRRYIADNPSKAGLRSGYILHEAKYTF